MIAQLVYDSSSVGHLSASSSMAEVDMESENKSIQYKTNTGLAILILSLIA